MRATKRPAGLPVTIDVDVVVDGVSGIGFVAGTEQGILFTLALTIEEARGALR